MRRRSRTPMPHDQGPRSRLSSPSGMLRGARVVDDRACGLGGGYVPGVTSPPHAPAGSGRCRGPDGIHPDTARSTLNWFFL